MIASKRPTARLPPRLTGLPQVHLVISSHSPALFLLRPFLGRRSLFQSLCILCIAVLKPSSFFSGQKGVYIPHGRASHSHLHIFCIRCLLAIEDAITIVEKKKKKERSTSSGTQFFQSLATQSSNFSGRSLHGFARQYRGLDNHDNEPWAGRGMSISPACVLLSVTGVANAF